MRIERLDVLHLENRPDLQMILQVGTNPRRIVHYANAMLLQQGRRANAGELQKLRRADAAGTQNHLGTGAGRDHFRMVPNLHTDAALTSIRLRLKQQLRHLGRGPHLEVGPGVAGGAQESLGGAPAPTLALVHLEVANALVVTPVEILGGSNAGLLRSLCKGIEHVPAQALLLDAPLATRPAVPQQLAVVGRTVTHQFRRHTARAVGSVGSQVMIFVQLEIRQGLVPGPGLVSRQPGPLVVITRLPAHVDHAVDAAAAAQRLAARVAQHPTIQARVGLGAVEPVGARVANAVQITHRNVDPVVVILAPGFDQQHTFAGVGR